MESANVCQDTISTLILILNFAIFAIPAALNAMVDWKQTVLLVQTDSLIFPRTLHALPQTTPQINWKSKHIPSQGSQN